MAGVPQQMNSSDTLPLWKTLTPKPRFLDGSAGRHRAVPAGPTLTGFTPVCTTEIGAVAYLEAKFAAFLLLHGEVFASGRLSSRLPMRPLPRSRIARRRKRAWSGTSTPSGTW